MSKNMTVAIILAGGTGNRTNIKIPKQFVNICGKTLLEWSLKAFESNQCINLICLVIDPSYKKLIEDSLEIETPIIFANPGIDRQKSVYSALLKIEQHNPKIVLVHDSARPCISQKLINRVLMSLKNSKAVIPVLPIYDTIKFVDAKNIIQKTINREHMHIAQTPQGFEYKTLIKAHRKTNASSKKSITDDASLLEIQSIKVKTVLGDSKNVKITCKEDFKIAEDNIKSNLEISVKTGLGFDMHPLSRSGKKVRLLGIDIPNDGALKGHSDADVGYHALCDSIFGALGIGDIGKIFKNTDKRWKNIDSKFFLEFAKNKIDDFEAEICNIDINFICEEPKIYKYSDKMKSNIAKVLNISEKKINIKATTNEKIGFIGKGNGIAAESIISISL